MSIPHKSLFIAPAHENIDLFTPTQLLLWQKLYGDAETILPLQRSGFNPMEFVDFLPNIWLGDLVVNDKNELLDVTMRLVGTSLTKVFGEITNQNMLTDNDENSFQKRMSVTYKRF
ncbi:MAG: hypothetical protein HOH18_09045, partial [Kordiimonadaceae bacterium]|nr:hypothetical protein [Kordiimonadaceae bacterium]